MYEEALFIRESYCTSIRSAACALQYAAKGQVAIDGNVTSIENYQQSHQFVPPGSNQPAASAPIHGGGSHVSYDMMSNQFVQTNSHPSLDAGSTPIQSDGTHAFPMVPTKTEEVVPEHARAEPLKHQAPVPQHAEEKFTVKPSTEPTEKEPSSSAEKQGPKEQPQEYELADSALPLMIVSLFSLFFSIVWFFCIKLPYRICSSILTFCVILISCRVLWLLFADDNGAWEMGAGVEYEYNAPGIY